MTMKVSKKTEVAGYSERMRILTEGLSDEWKVLPILNNSGWFTSVAGSGGYSVQATRMYVNTGTTANSLGMLYMYATPLNSGDMHYVYVDWTKRMEVELMIAIEASDPKCIRRIQIKESIAEGALAQRGIGLEIQNNVLVGEAYGTARGTVPLGTLIEGRIYRVRIVKTTDEVQFWVNGVLMGTLTGDAVPKVKGTATGYIVMSIRNGATGGVNAVIILFNGSRIIQEW